MKHTTKLTLIVGGALLVMAAAVPVIPTTVFTRLMLRMNDAAEVLAHLGVDQSIESINNILGTKAASDILDTSSIGSLGVSGTNTLSDYSAVDSWMVRRFIASPIIAGGDVTSYALDWNAGVSWRFNLTGSTLGLTDANRPTSALSLWGGKGWATNAGTSAIGVSMPDGWLSKKDIWPTSIATNDWMEFSWEWDGSNVWFDWQGPQASIMPKAYGGTANIHGLADSFSYASPVLAISAGTNVYPDFSQGARPAPVALSTNLFFADPVGLPASGRSVEMKIPVTNTNASGSVLVSYSDVYNPSGWTNTTQEVAGGNTIDVTLRSYGSTPWIILEGGVSTASAGEAEPAWVPGVLYDMESDHSFFISSATYAGLVNQQNTSSPHIGTKSLTITTTNVAHFEYRIPNQTARSEVWVAGTVGISSAPAAVGNLIGLRTTADSEQSTINISSGRALTVLSGGGTSSAAHATLVPTTGHVYWMLHYTKGTGANATSRLYVTADPSSGWGTPVESTNGSNTTDMRGMFYKNRIAFGSGRVIKHDHLVWSTEAIPASYYIGL